MTRESAVTTPAAWSTAPATTRPATEPDLPAIATLFGEAFDDYRRGLGVDAAALARLWRDSLAARLDQTTVATGPDGRVVGFVVTVPPGHTERYVRRGGDRGRAWRRELGLGRWWRLPVLFLPMALAYARRHALADELYVSLVGVEPASQGRGIGQALLAAAETEARARGASAVLLHTSSRNTRARAAYARAGYELVCTVRAPWPGPAGIDAYVALRKPLRSDATPRLDALAGRSPADTTG